MQIAVKIVSVLLGYAFGNISPGLIFAKLKGVNLREIGSGNVGSTNVKRALGLKFGLLTLLCDILKGIIPMAIVLFAFKNHNLESPLILSAYAGFGAVFGHLYPIALKFNGGKGIATSFGVILFTITICAPLTVLIFVVAVALTRYISLGSCLAAFFVPIQVAVFMYLGLLPYTGINRIEVFILFTIDALLCIFKHWDNIKRLINGTESKFSFKGRG